MALKAKRPSAGASRSGKKTAIVSVPVETIDARLERKSMVADNQTFATKSLGQMSREQRHKLLYGD